MKRLNSQAQSQPSTPIDIQEMKIDLYRRWWNLTRSEDDAVFCVVIGNPGKGKSTIAQAAGYMMQRNSKHEHTFSIEKNVYTRFIDFLEAIAKCKKKHQVFILEEAGTRDGIYNRNWFTMENKAAVEFMETIRHRNLILIFVVPERKFLDTQIRDFFNFQITAISKDRKEKYTMAKVKQIRRNVETGKEYVSYLTYEGETGIETKASDVVILGPPRWIMNAWKVLENTFKPDLLTRSISEIKAKSEDLRGREIRSNEDLFKEAVEKLDKIVSPDLRTKKTRLSNELIEVELKITENKAKRVRKMLENAHLRNEISIPDTIE